MEKAEKVTFQLDHGETESFYVLEQTRLGGIDYILVTDCAEGDGEAMILKDISEDGEEEGIYTVISDEDELAAVAGVFEDMLEDVKFE